MINKSTICVNERTVDLEVHYWGMPSVVVRDVTQQKIISSARVLRVWSQSNPMQCKPMRALLSTTAHTLSRFHPSFLSHFSCQHSQPFRPINTTLTTNQSNSLLNLVLFSSNLILSSVTKIAFLKYAVYYSCFQMIWSESIIKTSFSS